IEQFFEDPGGEAQTDFVPHVITSSGQVNFAVSFEERMTINDKRKAIERELDEWRPQANNVTTANVDDSITNAERHLRSIRELVDEVSQIVYGFNSSN